MLFLREDIFSTHQRRFQLTPQLRWGEDETPFQWASELDHSLAKNHKSSISHEHGKHQQKPPDEDKKR